MDRPPATNSFPTRARTYACSTPHTIVQIRELIENTGAFIDNEELTPRQMTTLVAITVGTIVAFEVVFVYSGA